MIGHTDEPGDVATSLLSDIDVAAAGELHQMNERIMSHAAFACELFLTVWGPPLECVSPHFCGEGVDWRGGGGVQRKPS